MNSVQLMGRLTRAAELKPATEEKKAVSNFTIAVDKGYSKEKKEELKKQEKATADFIPITAFDKVAENLAKYTDKGKRVIVEGTISTSNYTTKDGEKRFSMKVIANRVEFIDELKKTTDETENDEVFEPVEREEIPF